MVQYRRDAAQGLAAGVAGFQSDQVGVVELVIGQVGERVTRCIEALAAQGVGGLLRRDPASRAAKPPLTGACELHREAAGAVLEAERRRRRRYPRARRRSFSAAPRRARRRRPRWRRRRPGQPCVTSRSRGPGPWTRRAFRPRSATQRRNPNSTASPMSSKPDEAGRPVAGDENHRPMPPSPSTARIMFPIPRRPACSAYRSA
jgi:hypothetical protein